MSSDYFWLAIATFAYACGVVSAIAWRSLGEKARRLTRYDPTRVNMDNWRPTTTSIDGFKPLLVTSITTVNNEVYEQAAAEYAASGKPRKPSWSIRKREIEASQRKTRQRIAESRSEDE
jgi:hypothetical protein